MRWWSKSCRLALEIPWLHFCTRIKPCWASSWKSKTLGWYRLRSLEIVLTWTIGPVLCFHGPCLSTTKSCSKVLSTTANSSQWVLKSSRCYLCYKLQPSLATTSTWRLLTTSTTSSTAFNQTKLRIRSSFCANSNSETSLSWFMMTRWQTMCFTDSPCHLFGWWFTKVCRGSGGSKKSTSFSQITWRKR